MKDAVRIMEPEWGRDCRDTRRGLPVLPVTTANGESQPQYVRGVTLAQRPAPQTIS